MKITHIQITQTYYVIIDKTIYIDTLFSHKSVDMFK